MSFYSLLLPFQQAETKLDPSRSARAWTTILRSRSLSFLGGPLSLLGGYGDFPQTQIPPDTVYDRDSPWDDISSLPLGDSPGEP